MTGRADKRDSFINQRIICQIPSKHEALCWVLGHTVREAGMTRSPRKLTLVRETDEKTACTILLEEWCLKTKTKNSAQAAAEAQGCGLNTGGGVGKTSKK